jgi:hypothetical protein
MIISAAPRESNFCGRRIRELRNITSLAKLWVCHSRAWLPREGSRLLSDEQSQCSPEGSTQFTCAHLRASARFGSLPDVDPQWQEAWVMDQKNAPGFLARQTTQTRGNDRTGRSAIGNPTSLNRVITCALPRAPHRAPTFAIC